MNLNRKAAVLDLFCTKTILDARDEVTNEKQR